MALDLGLVVEYMILPRTTLQIGYHHEWLNESINVGGGDYEAKSWSTDFMKLHRPQIGLAYHWIDPKENRNRPTQFGSSIYIRAG